MLPGKPGGGRTPQKASDRRSTLLASTSAVKSQYLVESAEQSPPRAAVSPQAH